MGKGELTTPAAEVDQNNGHEPQPTEPTLRQLAQRARDKDAARRREAQAIATQRGTAQLLSSFRRATGCHADSAFYDPGTNRGTVYAQELAFEAYDSPTGMVFLLVGACPRCDRRVTSAVALYADCSPDYNLAVLGRLLEDFQPGEHDCPALPPKPEPLTVAGVATQMLQDVDNVAEARERVSALEADVAFLNEQLAGARRDAEIRATEADLYGCASGKNAETRKRGLEQALAEDEALHRIAAEAEAKTSSLTEARNLLAYLLDLQQARRYFIRAHESQSE